jgi:hypothetical protein
MREQAEADTSQASVLYRDGAAEQRLVENISARAVVAATAAHWFEWPAFYLETARVLVPGAFLPSSNMFVTRHPQPLPGPLCSSSPSMVKKEPMRGPTT